MNNQSSLLNNGVFDFDNKDTVKLAYEAIELNVKDSCARKLIRYIFHCEINKHMDIIKPTNKYLCKKFDWSENTVRTTICKAKDSQFILTTGSYKTRTFEMNMVFLHGKMMEILGQEAERVRQKMSKIGTENVSFPQVFHNQLPNTTTSELPSDLPSGLPSELPSDFDENTPVNSALRLRLRLKKKISAGAESHPTGNFDDGLEKTEQNEADLIHEQIIRDEEINENIAHGQNDEFRTIPLEEAGDEVAEEVETAASETAAPKIAPSPFGAPTKDENLDLENKARREAFGRANALLRKLQPKFGGFKITNQLQRTAKHILEIFDEDTVLSCQDKYLNADWVDNKNIYGFLTERMIGNLMSVVDEKAKINDWRLPWQKEIDEKRLALNKKPIYMDKELCKKYGLYEKFYDEQGVARREFL